MCNDLSILLDTLGNKRIFYIQEKMDFDEHEIIKININNDSNWLIIYLSLYVIEF